MVGPDEHRLGGQDQVASPGKGSPDAVVLASPGGEEIFHRLRVRRAHGKGGHAALNHVAADAVGEPDVAFAADF